MIVTSKLWWQTGIIYQVYPRSFQDSNSDGTGDLPGIIQRLSYLRDLGITAIWLSPIFTSPMKDFGYDISDYQDIDPLFGTMQDFDRLLAEAHANDIKIIIDFVPNHTSDKHPWFVESRSSLLNPKRDWYIWKDPKPEGQVPNNWLSVFGGRAWEFDELTGQYYYHAFLKEQPDLNWRNPEVQEAMISVMRFWLDKGVDGFRVDVLWHLVKDALLRDNPLNPAFQNNMGDYEKLLPVFSTDQPEVHTIVYKFRETLDDYDERMMIGEIYLPINRLVLYYGVEKAGAHLPFNFMLISLSWTATVIAAAIAEYEAALPENAWPNWVLGNHDQPRIASRIGEEQSRVAAVLLLTLRGTPTIYYGDELGMTDGIISPADMKDPQGLRMPGKNLSRDPGRTPMQWDNGPYAGFSPVKPWLPVNKTYKRINAICQSEDAGSHLNLYRRLIKLRQTEPSLREGNYRPIYADDQLLVYIRELKDFPAFLVICNFTHRPRFLQLPIKNFQGLVIFSTVAESEQQDLANEIQIHGDEAMLIKIKPGSE